MVQFLYQKLFDVQFITMLVTAIAAAATVLTIAMPLLEGSTLRKRMSAVTDEREKIRLRERERMEQNKQPQGLRQAPKAYMKNMVSRLNLTSWLGTDTAKDRLAMAGFRGAQHEVAFLFFRLVSPIALIAIGALYIFVILDLQKPLPIKIGGVILAAYLGIKAPEIYLSNIIAKRQLSITRAFPDALDLLLICVESGMSIEASFRKVSQEIGSQSIPLAEELLLATAELSYLSERRQAFENLAKRTGLDSVKSVCTSMMQAERYGTPVGTALRVLSQEFRDMRMIEAEKKAAALPPKLTVPMILFFLPVLFIVILAPALIQVFKYP